jgi:hypothetical protein
VCCSPDSTEKYSQMLSKVAVGNDHSDIWTLSNSSSISLNAELTLAGDYSEIDSDTEGGVSLGDYFSTLSLG